MNSLERQLEELLIETIREFKYDHRTRESPSRRLNASGWSAVGSALNGFSCARKMHE